MGLPLGDLLPQNRSRDNVSVWAEVQDGAVGMKKKELPEQIIGKLRGAEIFFGQGAPVWKVSRKWGSAT